LLNESEDFVRSLENQRDCFSFAFEQSPNNQSRKGTCGCCSPVPKVSSVNFGSVDFGMTLFNNTFTSHHYFPSNSNSSLYNLILSLATTKITRRPTKEGHDPKPETCKMSGSCMFCRIGNSFSIILLKLLTTLHMHFDWRLGPYQTNGPTRIHLSTYLFNCSCFFQAIQIYRPTW